MFQCGPAENFRCKFSKHANYTSAIFSIEKKVQPPPIPFKKVPAVTLSQNEIELKNLKGKSPSDSLSVKLASKNYRTGAAAVAVQAPTAKAMESSTINGTKSVKMFQFFCIV